jgi:hypothetical protein
MWSMAVSVMSDPMRGTLFRQFDTAWKLASYHLDGLTTEECLWRPARRGLHVHRDAAGAWRADWPDRESYDLGPPSIAWTTWHMVFWWSMVVDHAFGEGALGREAVLWPGDADAVRAELARLHDAWLRELESLSDDELRSPTHVRWPFSDRPFADLVAWVNVELAKNAAEVGYARFLYGARDA